MLLGPPPAVQAIAASPSEFITKIGFDAPGIRRLRGIPVRSRRAIGCPHAVLIAPYCCSKSCAANPHGRKNRRCLECRGDHRYGPKNFLTRDKANKFGAGLLTASVPALVSLLVPLLDFLRDLKSSGGIRASSDTAAKIIITDK